MSLAVFMVAAMFFSGPASADEIKLAENQEVKVTCDHGVTFWIAPERNAEGKIVLGGEPRITKIRCRDEDEGDANVFMVDGLPISPLRVRDTAHARQLFDLISTAGDLPAAPKPGS